MKKFTLFTLFAISLLLFGSGNIFAVPAVGDGTLGNPWQIANLADLQWLSTTTSQWVAGKYFEQTGDIDATGATPAITPIGITAASPFRGHYDGKGFTISNLTINNPSLKYRGLFGYTNAAIIQNLVLTDVNITGLGEVGGLVGYAVSSTITSCGVSGTVTAKETLTYNGTGKDAGGIAGFISTNSIVDKCWSSATIHAFQYAGGLIGYSLNPTTIENCYATGNATSSSLYAGGLIAYVNGPSSGTITKCYSTGAVSSTSPIGGFICVINISTETLTGCFWNTETSGTTTGVGAGTYTGSLTGLTTAQMQTNTPFLAAGWDETIWNIGDGISGGFPYLDWQSPGGTPLPVELSSFSAAAIGSTVKLSWNTATEVNNYGFEIECNVHTSTPLSVTNWEKIGFVNGNGNSNSPKSYSFVDDNVTSGEYSYRLKQIDNDGQFEYSKTIEVDMNGVKKFELSQNYPNPFNPATTIRFNLPEASIVKLRIFNILGQEISTLVNEFKESGTHTINFNASELSSGMYIYRIEAGNFVQTRKMTLLK